MCFYHIYWAHILINILQLTTQNDKIQKKNINITIQINNDYCIKYKALNNKYILLVV